MKNYRSGGKKSGALKLNFFHVALMYVGTIMGAGFASGREIWQFFGVFGKYAPIGVLLVGLMFILLGMMASYNARKLGTNDIFKNFARYWRWRFVAGFASNIVRKL